MTASTACPVVVDDPGNLKDGLGFGQPKELRLLGSRLPGLDLLDKPGDVVAARGQALVEAGRACVWQCDVLATRDGQRYVNPRSGSPA